MIRPVIRLRPGLHGLGWAAAVVLISVGGPALAQAVPAGDTAAANAVQGDTKSWGAFFGRTHVLFLHLPIGLLIGAFAIELFGLFRRSKGYDIAAAWLFVFGAGSSVLAVVTGLLLGTEWAAEIAEPGKAPQSVFALLFADSIEQGVTETLGWHMWLGITLMVAAIIAAVLKVAAVRRQWADADAASLGRGGWPLLLARLSILGAMAALPFAGHLGGNMTHGQDFLVERTPIDVPESWVYWPEAVQEQAALAENGEGHASVALVNGTAAFWDAKIQPALDRHCVDCHGASKPKGKLRLDSLAWAVKGGSSGGSIEAGDAEFSELYRRVALPSSHGDFMPPPKQIDKYGMLSLQEVHLLGNWIMAFSGELDPRPQDAAQTPAGP